MRCTSTYTPRGNQPIQCEVEGDHEFIQCPHHGRNWYWSDGVADKK